MSSGASHDADSADPFFQSTHTIDDIIECQMDTVAHKGMLTTNAGSSATMLWFHAA